MTSTTRVPPSLLLLGMPGMRSTSHFVFRGDGAAFALPPRGLMSATSVLRQVASLARANLNLALRIGLLPVSEIRSRARDVRIARYAASDNATYAMFTGRGVKWAGGRT
jgi:hypothetical protein